MVLPEALPVATLELRAIDPSVSAILGADWDVSYAVLGYPGSFCRIHVRAVDGEASADGKLWTAPLVLACPWPGPDDIAWSFTCAAEVKRTGDPLHPTPVSTFETDTFRPTHGQVLHWVIRQSPALANLLECHYVPDP
jgi:hypothetical protein